MYLFYSSNICFMFGAKVIQIHLKGTAEMGQSDMEFLILKYAYTNNQKPNVTLLQCRHANYVFHT